MTFGEIIATIHQIEDAEKSIDLVRMSAEGAHRLTPVEADLIKRCLHNYIQMLNEMPIKEMNLNDLR